MAPETAKISLPKPWKKTVWTKNILVASESWWTLFANWNITIVLIGKSINGTFSIVNRLLNYQRVVPPKIQRDFPDVLEFARKGPFLRVLRWHARTCLASESGLGIIDWISGTWTRWDWCGIVWTGGVFPNGQWIAMDCSFSQKHGHDRRLLKSLLENWPCWTVTSSSESGWFSIASFDCHRVPSGNLLSWKIPKMFPHWPCWFCRRVSPCKVLVREGQRWALYLWVQVHFSIGEWCSWNPGGPNTTDATQAASGSESHLCRAWSVRFSTKHGIVDMLLQTPWRGISEKRRTSLYVFIARAGLSGVVWSLCCVPSRKHPWPWTTPVLVKSTGRNPKF